jgi:lipopolysaccharide export LptBFGC system permease protein LptF
LIGLAVSGDLPFHESLAVFLGVTGTQWLIEGDADPFIALLLALAVGVAIGLARYLRSIHRD